MYFQSVEEGGGRPTLQNSSSFQKSQNPKIPTQGSDFWKLEREPQNPKIKNSSSFQKSKIPKTPTQVSDFLKLEREPQNPKNPKFLEFSKIQNSKNSNPSFGFLETRAGASKSKIRAPARVSKNPNLGVGFLGFLDFRKLERELDF